MKSTFRISVRDAHTISLALSDAIDERNSFVEAYNGVGKEAEAAKRQAERYDALHVKLFGVSSRTILEAHRLSKLPSVSIFDLKEGS